MPDQIEERLNAGDISGAVRQHVRENVVPALKATAEAAVVENQQELFAAQERAMTEFITKVPEANTEQFGYTCVSLFARWGLDGTQVGHWEQAWTFLNPAPARARQETRVPVRAPESAQEPVDPTQAALDAAARQLIADHGGNFGFKNFYNNLTAAQTERWMNDFAFQRAVELCFPAPSPNALTHGAFVHGARVVRTAEYAGADIANAEKNVAESRQATQAAFANHQEAVAQRQPGAPMDSMHARRSGAVGVVNQNRDMPVPRTLTDKQTREALDQRKRDNEAMEASREASFRVRRVKGNRSR